MAEFPIHDIDSAPEDSQKLLQSAQKEMGFVPNLYGAMAEAPQVLEAYQTLQNLFTQTSLGAVEQNVVWLAVNVEHSCHYCVPAHTAIAKSMDVPDDVIEALRNGKPLDDARLEALRTFALTVVRERGNVADADVAAFREAGFSRRNVLEVVLGVTQKVLSNYVNHLAETPVDKPFEQFRW